MRDDFSQAVNRIIAERVGYRCSNPGCRALTSGPQNDVTKFLNVGVAAHITAASPGGPRYDPTLSQETRKHPDNGIWLCQNCAKLVDNDPSRFPVSNLYEWKRHAEAEALALIGKMKQARVVAEAAAEESSEAEIRRNLALKGRMRKDFLKSSVPYRSGSLPRPYEKFAYGEVIVHSVDDSVYPEIDESPEISSWFKVELWDFYFNGLEVVLNIVYGIVDEDGRWSLFEYGKEFDEAKYRGIGMWQIGRIPWRNIAEYDLVGDEYYPIPHLYCRFANDGMPYEVIVYRVVDDRYDWPLKPEDQFEYEHEG